MTTLDHLPSHDIGLFCWLDVRPLAGVAGYIDWRLCGLLSQLLLSGRFAGSLGESLLLPIKGRFGPRRLFVFGLGKKVESQEKDYLAKAYQQAITIMQQAGTEQLMLAAPACPTLPDIEKVFAGLVADKSLPQIVRILLEKL